MKKLTELTAAEAKAHFLKNASYFNGDFPDYLNFGPITAYGSNSVVGHVPNFQQGSKQQWSDN